MNNLQLTNLLKDNKRQGTTGHWEKTFPMWRLSPADREIIEGLRGVCKEQNGIFTYQWWYKVRKFTGYKYLLLNMKLYFAFLLQNIIYSCVPIQMALFFLAYL